MSNPHTEAMTKQSHASEGAHFSGLISERGPGKWRALAWMREPDLTLKQRIGPQTLVTLPAAHDWLKQVAATLGFENFNIVIERLGDEGLLVEGISPDTVEEDLMAPDVDA
jgi:hypothetical protein